MNKFRAMMENEIRKTNPTFGQRFEFRDTLPPRADYAPLDVPMGRDNPQPFMRAQGKWTPSEAMLVALDAHRSKLPPHMKDGPVRIVGNGFDMLIVDDAVTRANTTSPPKSSAEILADIKRCVQHLREVNARTALFLK